MAIKISDISQEKTLKHNDDLTEVSYDDGSGYTTYKMKRQRVLELGASDLNSNVGFILNKENFVDVVYINTNNFVDSDIYTLTLPTADIEDFDLGTKIKVILLGNPIIISDDLFTIKAETTSDIIFAGDSSSSNYNRINDMGTYGYASLILSKNSNGNKSWLVLESTGIGANTI